MTTTKPENGQDVKLLQLNLDHASPDLHVYEGAGEIQIERVIDKRHHVVGVTGSWNEFSRLDVDQAFHNATVAAAGGTR